jgi:hypothetical protein
MTATEWLTATNPEPLLAFLRGKASDRKLRLFAVACCRRIWHVMIDERSRVAVEMGERSADETVDLEKLDQLSGAAEEAFEDSITDTDDAPIQCHSGVTPPQISAACAAASYASNSPVVRLEDAVVVVNATSEAVPDKREENRRQSELLRDIFGNPIRSVVCDPAWRSEPVSALAAGIYADRAFDRLPILADALEEAGCDDADILNHCRMPGPHVKGCWVVDLVLGKG